MHFASGYVYDAAEDEFECVSDDEFRNGMQVSDSDSEDEKKETETTTRPSLPVRCKRILTNHWRKKKNPKSPLKVPDTSSYLVTRPSTKRWFRRADTNIVSVQFDELLSPGNMHAGDPVICTSCQAILSKISKPVQDGPTKMWKCEFCGERSVIDIDNEEIPKSADVTYLLEPALATTTSTLAGRDQSLVIFVMDVSGSMCVTSEVVGKVKLRGTDQLARLQSFNELNENQFLPSQRNHNVTYISRLQSMQAAVDFQLGQMAKDHPNRRVGLVTFNNEVVIVGDGSQEEITVAGSKLSDLEVLTKQGEEVALPQSIENCRTVLKEKIYKLEEGGATALGPALIVALNMAAKHQGSKVILCTDGKANIGLGNLEDEDEDLAAEFYTSVGETALSKGVSISVITIQGTDCKLVHLGKLADKTGGQVNIVDPLKLTEEFGNILQDSIIATKVKATLILYKTLYVIDESNPDNQACRAEHCPGNVTSSSSITFEFAKRRKPKDSNEKPKKSESTDPAESNVASTSENKTSEINIPEVKVTPPEDSVAGETEEAGGEASASGGAAETRGGDAFDVPEYPFQLQIEYTDTEGNKALRVLTQTLLATTDRTLAEREINMEVIGSHVAKKSSDLALQGMYTESRGAALMHQRLAWRSSRNQQGDQMKQERTKYKSIFSRLKTMENQIGVKQMREINVSGRTASDSDTDDELEAALEAAPLPSRFGSLSEAAKSKSKQKSKMARIMSARSRDMDDSEANMYFQFRSMSSGQMMGPLPIKSSCTTTQASTTPTGATIIQAPVKPATDKRPTSPSSDLSSDSQ